VRIDWAEIRDFLNPFLWWSAYFGKVSYEMYICGQLVRLDAAPGRGFIASNEDYAQVAADVDARWQRVADQDDYPGHVEGFVADYAHQIDGQHEDPRQSWALHVSGLPAAKIDDPGHLDTIVNRHHQYANAPLCGTCGGEYVPKNAKDLRRHTMPINGCSCERNDDDAEYQLILSRERREWVATLTGPHLAEEGRTMRLPTLSGLQLATHSLYPLEELQAAWHATGQCDGSYSAAVRYDLGGEAGEHRAALFEARQARREASDEYHEHGRAAAKALADDGASLTDIAEVLWISRREAAGLIAYKPRPAEIMHFQSRSVTHLIRDHALPYLTHSVPAAVRQARVLADDVVREYRQGKTKA
jgi:hypothetical protein